MTDYSADLQQSVETAVETRTPLNIVGSGSKRFYGRAARSDAAVLDIRPHRGIVNYHPSELVLTARAGTPLHEIERTLAEHGQMLAFEPPYFGPDATLGGTVACGLSGPRRPFAGSLRDFVLGCKIINGKGEILRFGGEVMKNVAGFDVSRLMAGALGTLGVLLEISLKVLPKPVHERTLVFELSLEQALRRMLELARQPLPVSALCFDGRELFIRLSGGERTVRSTAMKLGGETAASDDFWRDLNEQRLAFFRKDRPLWRMSVPPATPPPALSGDCFYDWGGSQRWLYSDEPAGRLFAAAEASEGHASLFKGGDRSGSVFQPESEALLRIAGNLKRAFDPYGILNPGKKYEAW